MATDAIQVDDDRDSVHFAMCQGGHLGIQLLPTMQWRETSRHDQVVQTDTVPSRHTNWLVTISSHALNQPLHADVNVLRVLLQHALQRRIHPNALRQLAEACTAEGSDTSPLFLDGHARKQLLSMLAGVRLMQSRSLT